jgi:hypothetical protein
MDLEAPQSGFLYGLRIARQQVSRRGQERGGCRARLLKTDAGPADQHVAHDVDATQHSGLQVRSGHWKPPTLAEEWMAEARAAAGQAREIN